MPTSIEPTATSIKRERRAHALIGRAEELVVNGVGYEILRAAAQDRRYREIGQGQGENDQSRPDEAGTRQRQNDMAEGAYQLAPSEPAADSSSAGMAVSAGASISTAKGSMY